MSDAKLHSAQTSMPRGEDSAAARHARKIAGLNRGIAKNDAHRCIAKNAKGDRCPHPALRGGLRCQSHETHPETLASRSMANFYLRGASKVLAEKIKALDAESQKRYSLQDEVDISRIMLEQAVRQYDSFVLDDSLQAAVTEGKLTPEQLGQMKQECGRNLRQALDHLRDMVSAAQKNEKLREGTIQLETIKALAAHVNKAVAELGLPAEIGVRLSNAIGEFKVPEFAPTQVSIVI